MAEYIDRQAAIDSLLGWADQLTETYGKNDEYVKCLESAAYNIEQIPAADVRPVVRARWRYKTMTVPGGKGQTYAKWCCTACKGKAKERTHFCPNCGADMREES